MQAGACSVLTSPLVSPTCYRLCFPTTKLVTKILSGLLVTSGHRDYFNGSHKQYYCWLGFKLGLVIWTTLGRFYQVKIRTLILRDVCKLRPIPLTGAE